MTVQRLKKTLGKVHLGIDPASVEIAYIFFI